MKTQESRRSAKTIRESVLSTPLIRSCLLSQTVRLSRGAESERMGSLLTLRRRIHPCNSIRSELSPTNSKEKSEIQ